MVEIKNDRLQKFWKVAVFGILRLLMGYWLLKVMGKLGFLCFKCMKEKLCFGFENGRIREEFGAVVLYEY